MAQDMEECEVFEIDSEQPDAGTVVDYYKPTGRVRHTVPRPFDAVVAVLVQAGWGRAKPGYDEAGNRVWYLNRQPQQGRSIDDTLDTLR